MKIQEVRFYATEVLDDGTKLGYLYTCGPEDLNNLEKIYRRIEECFENKKERMENEITQFDHSNTVEV